VGNRRDDDDDDDDDECFIKLVRSRGERGGSRSVSAPTTGTKRNGNEHRVL
jgi:hypothetical protein